MEQLITVDTLEGLSLLSEYIKPFEYVTYDTETVGVHHGAQIIGFSVCAEDSVAFYVVLYRYSPETGQLIELETTQGVKPFLEQLLTKKLIMHNAPFDCAKTNDIYKIDLMPSLHTDTLILAHLLNENRRNGLKDLGASIFGADSIKEQAEMKTSVLKNGGVLTKDKYEMYKADTEVLAKYGAKDALLTYKLFYVLVPILMEEGLDKFFYDEESMPLLKGPTYELNTTGLKVERDRLQKLRGELEVSIMEAHTFIESEVKDLVKAEYPATNKKNKFNIGSNRQLAWLLFGKLGEHFNLLTPTGLKLCKYLGLKAPYAPKDKIIFIRAIRENKGQLWKNEDTGLQTKIGDPWQYMQTDASTIGLFAKKYKWAERLLQLSKDEKTLSTYVISIQEKIEYGIIRPSFLQFGTTSGRYSSKVPNFQNLPRDDKRIKACIISRPGKVLIGADYSQLEPRVFASVSQDPRLLKCFEQGEDFYSVVGMPIFGITDCSTFKDHPEAFATKHKSLRNVAKAFALATAYGTSAARQASALDKKIDECKEIIGKYFQAYPKVELMMLESHEMVKANGYVHSLYGRPRRIPAAKDIAKVYGPYTPHGELPYEARNLLNLAINHRVQSSAASIVNRAMIAFYNKVRELFLDAKIVCQVHDEIIVECREQDSEIVANILQDCMENTTLLPGVKLVAEPAIANNFADLK